MGRMKSWAEDHPDQSNIDLYEAMIDMDDAGVQQTIASIKKVLNDIQRSYHDELQR